MAFLSFPEGDGHNTQPGVSGCGGTEDPNPEGVAYIKCLMKPLQGKAVLVILFRWGGALALTPGWVLCPSPSGNSFEDRNAFIIKALDLNLTPMGTRGTDPCSCSCSIATFPIPLRWGSPKRREGMESRVLWDVVSFTSTSTSHEYDHEEPLPGANLGSKRSGKK